MDRTRPTLQVSITTKLILLAVVPLLGLTMVAGLDVVRAARSRTEAAQLVSLADLSTKTTSLVHSLQAERGTTNTYLASKGTKLADTLPKVQAATDTAYRDLLAFLGGADGGDIVPAEVATPSRTAVGAFADLASRREATGKLAWEGADAVAYFTGGIGQLLDSLAPVATASSDSALSRELVAVQAFGQAKERAGQQRAQLAAVFTKDGYAAGQQGKILGLDGAQDAFLHTYSAVGGPDAAAKAASLQNSPETSAVEAFTSIAASQTSRFGVDPAKWFAAASARIDLMRQVEMAGLEQVRGQAADAAVAAQRTFLVTLLALLATGLTLTVAAYRVVRGIVTALAVVRTALDDLAAGHLENRVEVRGTDEIAQMSASLNHALDALGSALNEMHCAADQLHSSSDDLSGFATNLQTTASGSAQQAGSAATSAEVVSSDIASVAAASEELAASISEIARSAAAAQQISEQAVGVARQAGETVSELGASSRQISDVLAAVSAIAAQTNLLALNATIEAARAGEAGKGFAVVAGEVKDLALETATATDGIAKKITAIQSDAKAAVDTIASISAIINQMSEVQTSIAAAVEEQEATTREIQIHVQSAANRSQDIAGMVGSIAESASSAHAASVGTGTSAAELARMAGQMQTVVGRFTLEDARR